MILGDGAVRLRPWRPDDAEAIQPALGDPRITRFSSLPDGVQAWLAEQRDRPGRISLAITQPPDDRALGKVALRLADAELSYWLVPAARGRGLATRAVRLLAAHAFERLGMEELRLEVEPDNAPSLRVAAALGAEHTGNRTTEVDRDGVRRELLVFGVRSP